MDLTHLEPETTNEWIASGAMEKYVFEMCANWAATEPHRIPQEYRKSKEKKDRPRMFNIARAGAKYLAGSFGPMLTRMDRALEELESLVEGKPEAQPVEVVNA